MDSQANSLSSIEKVGFAPFDKYNFIVFKQDMENDSVVIHHVQVGYCEFQY